MFIRNLYRCVWTKNVTRYWFPTKVALVLVCFLSVTLPAFAELDPGSAENPNRSLPQWLAKQLDSGVKRVRIQPGRYYVSPRGRMHLELANLNGVEIDASGVEMVCTQTTRAITIDNCKDLTIRGLTIDYDPLPYTQGRIVALSEDKRSFTVDLLDGYPRASTIRGDKCEVYDGTTHQLTTKTYYDVEVDQRTEKRILVSKPNRFSGSRADEKVGDIIVLDSRHAPGRRLPHAIQIDDCSGLTLADVTLYGSTSFGFFETDSQSNSYINCTVDRRPIEQDLKPRAHPRMRSLNADAFHSKHASVGPTYRSCIARYMGDDGIAINTAYCLVMGSDGATLRVIGRKQGLKIGERVDLVTYEGERLDQAVIQGIRESDRLLPEESQFIDEHDFADQTRDRALGQNNVYTIDLDRPVALPMGSLVASADRAGNGFKIINCEIGPNRSRGILVKAGHGVIASNTLRDNWGESIKVAPEWYWLEAGSSDKLLIENNRITDPRKIAIAVYAFAGNGELASAGFHRDITIRSNRITGAPAPAIYVTSISRLSLGVNKIEIDLDRELPSGFLRMMKIRDPDQPVYEINTEP